MAAVQNIPMLSCADIYFVNDDGKYRLQWSTNALIEGISKPVLDDDDYDEYYRQLAKYNYIKKHKNDSSNTAAKFLCQVQMTFFLYFAGRHSFSASTFINI